MSKKVTSPSAYTGLTLMPNITPLTYSPGAQPNAPGESVAPGGGAFFQMKGWPTTAPVLNMLASFQGVPQERAGQAQNDRYAVLPSNFLFLAGVAGKSQG